MKKTIIAVLATGVALTTAAGLAACDNTPKEEGTYYTVTYYDVTADGKAGQVLKTERVKEGEVAPEYIPTKEGGYEFVNWFGTPSRNHIYDITAPVTGDVNVYAGFTLFENDTRDFYIIGAGTSTVLIDGWGVINDAHKLTKAEDDNVYTITLDVMKDDEFVFVQNADYYCKRGAGYLTTSVLTDGTAAFSGAGTVYDDSTKGANIKCEYSGNYTFTLKTYPHEDYYNTSGTGYTEATKEIYNLGVYDTISWVRNGDPESTSVTTTEYYIKGSVISDWGDMVNNDTKMTANGDVYTISKYLKAGEEFMFATWVTVTEEGEVTASNRGPVYVNSKSLDVASRELVDGYSEAGGNMTAKASGNYTFTYNKSTEVLSIAFTADELTDHDYYLDGKFGSNNWLEADIVKNPFTAGDNGIYTITNLALKVGDSLTIRSYPKGTATPNWTSFDAQYGYYNINPKNNANFDAQGANNFEVKVAGNYNISIDNYSKVITIVPYVDPATTDPYDVYIKGAQWGSNWPLLESNILTRNDDNHDLYEIELTLVAGQSFGFQQCNTGSQEQISYFNGVTIDTTGTYKITLNIATGDVTTTLQQAATGALYQISLKGSQWGGWATLNDFTQSATNENEYELTIAIDQDCQFGGVKAYNGVGAQLLYINGECIGTSGDANANFETDGNFVCNVAGTYKIVFNVSTDKIDFYSVD